MQILIEKVNKEDGTPDTPDVAVSAGLYDANELNAEDTAQLESQEIEHIKSSEEVFKKYGKETQDKYIDFGPEEGPEYIVELEQ